ncbi:hypothetical protein MKK75_01360 [Methylobacterium sp. J-030]|uniref:hypothetical protein n=1 Tax=Methylobacterium sp. J-030 TaxID=2836627 RepID=UPI001FB9F724|nr:hypothetical protein [Methylobacterium sp. J-030]MCJ2067465.1 hypothetical protein [Methylobacterium sp. J-030]
MFDFSWTAILMAVAPLLWAAISPVTLKILCAAFFILVFGRIVLPTRLRIVGLTMAAGVAAFAFCWQVAVLDGARRMLVHDHAVAIRAERERADLAEAVTRDLAEQATRDLAAEQADRAKLKDLNDVLAKNPRRGDVCLPQPLSRRLRQL